VPYKEILVAKNINLSEGTVLSIISKAKAKGHGPDEMSSQTQVGARKEKVPVSSDDVPQKGDIDIIVSKIYKDYESYLRKNNSLDFDDLLIFGVKLFSRHRKAVQWCKHVLVDEL
jgi:DNA helicase-2/ATP-dependent DNA helicase PcrA